MGSNSWLLAGVPQRQVPHNSPKHCGGYLMNPETNTKTDYVVTRYGEIIGTFTDRLTARHLLSALSAAGWLGVGMFSRVVCTETIYQEVE